MNFDIILSTLNSFLITFAVILGITILLMLLIYPMVFWVCMLIDCINRDFKETNEKYMWILIVFFGNLLGAILYYCCVKTKK